MQYILIALQGAHGLQRILNNIVADAHAVSKAVFPDKYLVTSEKCLPLSTSHVACSA